MKPTLRALLPTNAPVSADSFEWNSAGSPPFSGINRALEAIKELVYGARETRPRHVLVRHHCG